MPLQPSEKYPSKKVNELTALGSDGSIDPSVFGHRLRHHRRRAGMTLERLGEAVGRPASYLSQLENGRREPRLSTVNQLAAALGARVGDLLEPRPPDRRSMLELTFQRMQEDPRYVALQLPLLRPSARVDDVVLQHLVALFDKVKELGDLATPQTHGARAANVAMREQMRRADNYYPDIEAIAADAVGAIGEDGGGVVSERALASLAAHFGFSIARAGDLPASTRSVTDLRNRVIYVAQRNDLPPRTARSVVAQTLGHFALGHHDPVDFADYVRQRVEANYFAGALLAPERAAVPLLAHAKLTGDLAVDDLRDVFYLSYEMAAHRLTNLITRHLDIPVHFTRSDPEGVVWKAYENDDVPLPADPDGTVEGQRLCRQWGARTSFDDEETFAPRSQYTATSAGTFLCITVVGADGVGRDAVTVGTPERYARYFRGNDTTARRSSRCPDPRCCREPEPDMAARWAGVTWASARDRSHFVSGLPTDAISFNPYPGVDLGEVVAFLDRHDRP